MVSALKSDKLCWYQGQQGLEVDQTKMSNLAGCNRRYPGQKDREGSFVNYFPHVWQRSVQNQLGYPGTGTLPRETPTFDLPHPFTAPARFNPQRGPVRVSLTALNRRPMTGWHLAHRHGLPMLPKAPIKRLWPDSGWWRFRDLPEKWSPKAKTPDAMKRSEHIGDDR
jgi:hypothetical protein